MSTTQQYKDLNKRLKAELRAVVKDRDWYKEKYTNLKIVNQNMADQMQDMEDQINELKSPKKWWQIFK